jgi:hypothetical protein
VTRINLILRGSELAIVKRINISDRTYEAITVNQMSVTKNQTSELDVNDGNLNEKTEII